MLNHKTTPSLRARLLFGMMGGVIAMAGCAQNALPASTGTAAVPVQTVAPTATDTPGPTLTPAATATATLNLAATTAACQPAVQVTDVTVPDGLRLKSGETFIKTWRFLNSGNCVWEKGATLVFQSGEKFSAPETVLMGVLDAGQSVEVSMTMKSPREPGTYAGLWALQQPSGKVVTVADVSIVVFAPTPTHAATPAAPAARPTVKPAGGSIPPVGSGAFNADSGASGPHNCTRISEDEWVGEFYIGAYGGPGNYTISDPQHCQWDFSQQRFVCHYITAFTGSVMLSLQVSCPGCQPQDVAVAGRGAISVNGLVPYWFNNTCAVPPRPWGIPKPDD